MNTFIWTDLSTFDVPATQYFYSEVFGWKSMDTGGEYWLGQVNGKDSAGLYKMPEKFQDIGMPSFWMSYIQVEDIHRTVEIAAQQGGKVEVQPEAFPGGGYIALIRDPLGAGFTCYQGDDQGGRDASGTQGRMFWNELHVSEISKVDTFYKAVFDWDIRKASEADRYEIYASEQPEAIAAIQVTSNDIKGDKEYWGVYFAVESLEQSARTITRAGGEIVLRQSHAGKPSLLASDPQGAAFYIVEVASNMTYKSEEQVKNQQAQQSTGKASGVKWRALIGLLVVAIAVVFNANWVWGILFLIWVAPDIKSGSTHFMEYVDKKNNPILFWAIMLTWIVLSLYLLLSGVLN